MKIFEDFYDDVEELDVEHDEVNVETENNRDDSINVRIEIEVHFSAKIRKSFNNEEDFKVKLEDFDKKFKRLFNDIQEVKYLSNEIIYKHNHTVPENIDGIYVNEISKNAINGSTLKETKYSQWYVKNKNMMFINVLFSYDFSSYRKLIDMIRLTYSITRKALTSAFDDKTRLTKINYSEVSNYNNIEDKQTGVANYYTMDIDLLKDIKSKKLNYYQSMTQLWLLCTMFMNKPISPEFRHRKDGFFEYLKQYQNGTNIE